MPLLRSGIIVGRTEQGRVIIDCPVYFGNSGGLVIEVVQQVSRTQNLGPTISHARYLGIGIAVEMIPFVEKLWSKQFSVQTGIRYENSGYSIVEPMENTPATTSLNAPMST